MGSHLYLQNPGFSEHLRSNPLISKEPTAQIHLSVSLSAKSGGRKKEHRLILKMEEMKKRKLDELQNGDASSTTSEEHLRSLLEPLAKSQLVDLLAKLYATFTTVFFYLDIRAVFESIVFAFESSLLGFLVFVFIFHGFLSFFSNIANLVLR